MSNRSVDITRLKKGVVLLIETKGSVYEIVILDPSIKLVSIVGGGERFPSPVHVTIIGSIWGKEKIPNKLEIGMAMEIILVENPNRMITTGAIKSLKVSGKGYSYEL